MQRNVWTALFGALSVFGALAGPALADPPVIAPEEEIVIEAPGPELWRLYDADSEVFILASLGVLPERFRWNSRPVAAALARADRLYVSESITLGLNDAARLLVTRRDAIRNPDGTALSEYLPAGLYQRLQAVARAQNVDPDELEQWRPYVAGGQVWGAAIENAGLSTDQGVTQETRRLARRARVRIEEVSAGVDAGDLMDALNAMPLGRDNACLALYLDSVEAELPLLRARSEAWARGDVAVLRETAELIDPSACLASLGGGRLSFEMVEARFIASWRDTLGDALDRPGVRVAVVNADFFLRRGGVLEGLRAAGYSVDGP